MAHFTLFKTGFVQKWMEEAPKWSFDRGIGTFNDHHFEDHASLKSLPSGKHTKSYGKSPFYEQNQL
jgi:hypothetical protein